MRRREFIALLFGAAVASPFAARAQQSAMPVIGYLIYTWAARDCVKLASSRAKNVTIEYRWAEFEHERLAQMAADLVRHSVTAIAALGGTPPALVAKAATSTIPIVFQVGINPVEFGLVTSLNRPGGNMTGIAALQGELVAKRIEMLHEMAPKASVVALLVNPNNRYRDRNANIAGRRAFSRT